MAHGWEGLLAQIEAGVHDHTVPLSSMLQKCILLGNEAASEKMRDWTRQELKGYVGADDLPHYRHIPAALMAVITNHAGYNPRIQRVEASIFPTQVYEMLVEKIDLEDATLGDGLGVLEALANQDADEHKVVPYWATFIVDTLNKFNAAPNSRVTAVYWSVSSASIRGLLVQVRAALAELVAELRALTPQDQEVPDRSSKLPSRSQRGVSQGESGGNPAIAGFEIHHDVIARMMREIQDSFDRHPIRVPVNADGPTPGTTIYNGPVIHGDANGARLAWGNQDVDQSQTNTQQIAPGFEPIAQAVARTLEQLSVAGLSERDQEDAEDAAKEVLSEVTQPEPNQGKIRRALAALKHLLAPVAAGAAAGAGQGAQEWAKAAIEHLQPPF